MKKKNLFYMMFQCIMFVLALVASGGYALAADVELGNPGGDTDPNAGTPGEGTVHTVPTDKGGGFQPGHDTSASTLDHFNLLDNKMFRKIIEYRAERHPLFAAIFSKATQFPFKGHKEAEYPEFGDIRLESRTTGVTNTSKAHSVVLPLPSNDNYIFRKNYTAIVWGVNGYDEDGKANGDMLCLYVTANNEETGAPTVIAVNGPLNDSGDTYVPDIPAGTLITLGAAALAEEEVEVDPINAIPTMNKAYLQKKAYSVAITDFFNEAVKEVDWEKDRIKREALAAYKKTYVTTALFSPKRKWYKKNKNGIRNCYTQQGIISQLRMGFQLEDGKVKKSDLIGIAKMLFTQYTDATEIDVYCGSDFMESLLNIDWGKDTTQVVYVKDKDLNVEVASFKCAFGKLNFHHETGLTEHHLGGCAIALPMDECIRVYRDNGSTKKVDGNKGETGAVEELTKEYFLQDDCFIIQAMSSMLIGPSSAFGTGMTKGINSILKSVTELPENPQDGDKVYLTETDGEYPRGAYVRKDGAWKVLNELAA